MMEKIKVLVYVSEKAAILAGRSECGRALVTIDPAELTPEQREELTLCLIKRVDEGDNTGDYLDVTGGAGMPLVAEATPETVLMLLEARRVLRTEREQQAAEQKVRQTVAHDKRVKEWLAANVEEFLSAPHCVHDRWTIRRPGTYNAPPADERLDELNAAAVLLMAERNNVLELEREAKRRANEQARLNCAAAEKARTEAQDKQAREWVAKYGSPDQQERQEVKLLPRDEIVDCIRGYAFSVLDKFPRYERLQANDVCESDCGNKDADVEWETSDAETATSFQWRARQAIRAELKDRDDATVVIRRHYGECDCGCEGEAERFSIRVEIKVGAFTFSREYESPEVDEHVDVEE